MYKIVAAVALLVFSVGSTAEEFFAVITKVDGNKITLTKYEKGEKGKGGTKGEENDPDRDQRRQGGQEQIRFQEKCRGRRRHRRRDQERHLRQGQHRSGPGRHQ